MCLWGLDGTASMLYPEGQECNFFLYYNNMPVLHPMQSNTIQSNPSRRLTTMHCKSVNSTVECRNGFTLCSELFQRSRMCVIHGHRLVEHLPYLVDCNHADIALAAALMEP